jgi:hypothetical protein
MQQLTTEGRKVVEGFAQRHGFSPDAVSHMLFAVLAGNGTMAQFDHPEFAGSGQWMRGGMIMLGDMFNNALKGRVDALCSEIAAVLASQPGLLQSGSFQSQSQGAGVVQTQRAGMPPGPSSLFVPDPAATWWPSELGVPSATGSQNETSYAYFAAARRLAVKTPGQVWVYDTLDHQIGGFSQQQGGGGSILFTSQYGTVYLNTLPVVSINGQPPKTSHSSPPESSPADRQQAKTESDVYTAIERLSQLHQKGVLSDKEFSEKKAELLSRI